MLYHRASPVATSMYDNHRLMSLTQKFRMKNELVETLQKSTEP